MSEFAISKDKPWTFIVNVLGEIFRRDNPDRNVEADCVLASVNICEVARRLFKGDEELYNEWSNEADKGPISKRVNLAVEREFRRQERDLLNPCEFKIQQKIAKFQKINHNRFRVYGGMRGKQSWMKLVTEVIHFVDDIEFWNNVKKVAKANGATVILMYDETEHTDKCGDPTQGEGHKPVELRKQILDKGRILLNDGQPDDEGYIWSVSKDHGRMERQVELAWDVLNVPDVRTLNAMILRLCKATDAIWTKGGVGVC